MDWLLLNGLSQVAGSGERDMKKSEKNLVVSVYDNIMVNIWSNGKKQNFSMMKNNFYFPY